jgi:thymidine kinase
VPLADSVTKLSARCAYCSDNHKASFTLRIAADDRQEVVGGADKYAPVCRFHYLQMSRIREVGAEAIIAQEA